MTDELVKLAPGVELTRMVMSDRGRRRARGIESEPRRASIEADVPEFDRLGLGCHTERDPEPVDACAIRELRRFR